MAEKINEHEFIPSNDQIIFMAANNMRWIQRHQQFNAGDWDWEARIGICPDGKWKAIYNFDDGAVGMHGRRWESAKFDDPIACLVNAKLENWGN
ncbi:hypothetical protein [Pseudomonas mediterranea]|uniref:hypothetical protein n=1 Tax=Pseudomonas mediterranea TaxID=183795 RepID=UPI0006D8C3C8|nr:hypothetical protein [Pseudomonas mediterranea]